MHQFSYAQESQQQYSQDHYQVQQQQMNEHAQQQQQQQPYQQEQGVQTSFSQPPFQQNNSFANRYPAAASPYGAHQTEDSQAQQQQVPSAYAPFKPDPVQQSYYQNAAPQHSHSPAPVAPGQNAQSGQSSYGAFNSLPQAGQPGAFGASQGDYSSYAQEPLRNMVRHKLSNSRKIFSSSVWQY